MKAIRVSAPGGPEALRLEDVAVPSPKEGEALVRTEAVNNVVEHGVHGHGNQGARHAVA